MRPPELQQAVTELGAYPSSLYEAFVEAEKEATAAVLDDAQAVRWAQEGLRIAQQTVRSWEAAAEYFKASPRVLSVLSFAPFLRWAESGATVCHASPTVAAAFFKASPQVLGNLPPRHIAGWAGLGRSLSKGTWKSSNLAAKFFEASPDLLTHLNYRELELFVGLVETLSHRSYDLATECLHLGQRVFPGVEEREELISLAAAVAEQSWREVRGCFEAASHITSNVDKRQRRRFILLAQRLAQRGMSSVSGFILEATQALARLPAEEHRQVIDWTEHLAEYSLDASGAFLRSMPRVMERVSFSQAETWHRLGLETLQENPDSGIAYFKLESTRSEEVLDTLSSSLELGRVKTLLGRYSRALVGTDIDVRATQELTNMGIGWVSAEQASTDGTSVYLPESVDRYAVKSDNFSWFKVVTTHQVSHLEFGSFEFQYERPSALFEDLRPRLTPPTPPAENGQGGFSSDMSRFFDLFANRRLASDIFSVTEDARADYLLKHRYRGIVPDYRRVQLEALAERPPMEEMPLQQAMVELLVRLSLHQYHRLPVPAAYLDQAKALAALLRRVQDLRAQIEDTAEATLRMYHIIAQLPTDPVPPEQWEDHEFGDEEPAEEDVERLVEELQREGGQQDGEQDAYESPQSVDFRGEFKPEMVQLLAKMRGEQGPEGEPVPLAISQEALQELLQNSAELELSEGYELGAVADNLIKVAGTPPTPKRPGQGYGHIAHEDETGGSLDTQEPPSFVYDEWDFRANDYRPRWCVVQEKQVASGDTRFFNETLQNYMGLMEQIRRQFELVKPEMQQKVRRVKEGEDIDLDAALEAMVDWRAGHTPDDRVYWHRNKVQRDVGVAFLLDMSASTAEAIEESKRDASDWEAPSDPVEYAVWLRNRRSEGGRRPSKRIIDVEKESMVLLSNALEAIGDPHGIYGFSGFGRENVEFYVIKEMEEALSEQVKQRLDKVSPLHATRMGPAIRHATTKLDAVQAKTKFLFVISDGRPQDRGYSREGVEKEYAVQDTRMALLEARRKDITPFCLTVDRQGHDYLKTMAGDLGYEVLPAIMDLPQRLPYLYRRLTF